MAALTPAQAQAAVHRLPLDAPILEVYLNGFYACLYFATATAIWQSTEIRFKTWGTVLTVLYICATIHCAVQWHLETAAFSNYGATPDLYFVLTHADSRLVILGSLTAIINLIVPDAVLIWRCWIVWGRSWFMVVIPLLASLGATACAIVAVTGEIGAATLPTNGPIDPGKVKRLLAFLKYGTPAFALTFAVTMYTTLVILLRIFLVHRAMKKQRGVKATGLSGLSVVSDSSPYSSIIEILLESSVVYSIAVLTHVVFLAQKSENQVWSQSYLPQIAGIAPTLLMYRIARGHARKEREWKDPATELEFASYPPATDTTTSGLASGTDPSSTTRHRGTSTMGSGIVLGLDSQSSEKGLEEGAKAY
ncbi:hypothetical protein MKEN_00539100 [Mycena kentingensis (nom. inval.)]|nr:hypothetical protein MKEN_00539100 [Mycena kentingensis (nom. inval.)]